MSNNRQNLLNKIRALMAKTVKNGCSEAEAMSALNMAQAMMDAYEVTDDDLKLEGEKAAVAASDMKDTHNIRAKLAVVIADFTGCKVWTSGKKINFCGLQSDTDFAVWLTETLAEFVKSELKRYIWGNKLTALENSLKRRHINGFVLGCCNRINDRLRALITASHIKASASANALVIAKNELIDIKMEDLGLKLRVPRHRKSYIEGNSYSAGKSAGDKASFGRPVNGGSAVLRIR